MALYGPWGRSDVRKWYFWKIRVVLVHISPILHFVVSSAHDSGAGTEAALRLSVSVLVRLYQNYFDEIEVSRLKHRLLQTWNPSHYIISVFFVIKNMRNVQRMVSSINVHGEATVLCIVFACNGFTFRCKGFDRIPKSWYVFWSTACWTVNVHYAHGWRWCGYIGVAKACY